MSSPLAALLVLTLGAAELADPTQPPASLGLSAGAESASLPRLSSILVSPERRVAVIDGGLVREGERVGGARVVRIEPYAVHLSGPGGAFVLRLSGSPLKREERLP